MRMHESMRLRGPLITILAPLLLLLCVLLVPPVLHAVRSL